MPRPIIFRIGRLSGLKSRPALIEGPLPQTPLVEPSTRRLNNGPAEYDLLMMAGISVLLSATPAPDPQWQSNAPELQGRTHELTLIQSQQFSGLLRAQAPGVTTSQGHVLVVDPGRVDAHPSTLLRAFTPAVATNQPHVLTVDPGSVEVPSSKLLRSLTPTTQAANQGRMLVVDPISVDVAPAKLLKSQVPLSLATFNPRLLVSNTPWVDVPESFSYSQYLIEFDAPLLKPLVVDPERPQEFASKLLRAYDVTPPQSFQSNAPEIQALTHELAFIQSQQFSTLLRAFDTTPAVTSGIQPRVLNAPAADVQAYPSFRIQAQTPLSVSGFQPRMLVSTPDSQPDIPAKLFAPRFEATAVLAGIQPRVLVVQAQGDIDGLFTSASKLVVPNHAEPFVPTVGKDFFPGVGGAPAKRYRERKKYLVEIDGHDFYVASASEASGLLAQAQQLAEEKAQQEFDKALASTLKLPKLRRVIAHKLQLPVIRVPQAEIDPTAAAIEQQARAIQANIAQLYADIARSIEIGVILRKQLDDDDEEAITVLLL